MSSKLLTPPLVLVSALVLGAHLAHAQQPRLIRIAPRAQQAAAPFDAAEWDKRLSATDLGQRERAYGEFAELARRNAEARAWLREQSRGSGELAWTCRLLQRELDQPFAGLRGSSGPQSQALRGFDFQPYAFRGDPLATQSELDALREHMQQMFDDMQGRLGQWQPVQPRQPGQPAAPGLPGVQGSSRSLQLEQGPDGCKVTVEEDVDGRIEKKTYSAANLDELLDAHPELREKIGITVDRPRVFSFGGQAGGMDPNAFQHWFQRDDGAHVFARGALRTDILGVVVSGVPDERAGELGLDADEGLLVQRTEPGTIAGVLGIGAGDVLVEINGRRIHTSADIGAVLRERRAGDEVSVTWYDANGHQRTRTWRDGEGAQKRDGEGAQKRDGEGAQKRDGEGAQKRDGDAKRAADGAAKPLNAPKQDV